MKFDLKKTAGTVTAVLVILGAVAAGIKWFGGRVVSPSEMTERQIRSVTAEEVEPIRTRVEQVAQEQDIYHAWELQAQDSAERERQASRDARQGAIEQLQTDVKNLSDMLLIDKCLEDKAEHLLRGGVLAKCDSLGIHREVGDIPPAERG